VLQIGDHVRGRPVDAANFLRPEYPGFEKLRPIVGHTDSGEGHAFFECRDPVGIAAAATRLHPAFTQRLGIFDGVRMVAAPTASLGLSLARNRAKNGFFIVTSY